MDYDDLIYDGSYVKFSDLVGKVLVSAVNIDNEKIVFTTNTNEVYVMLHEQDCCESVYVESIVGDLEDLINTPIIIAEESSNSPDREDEDDDTCTWTFYKIDTVKGGVTIRWLGTSNGYYSESVSFFKLKEPV